MRVVSTADAHSNSSEGKMRRSTSVRQRVGRQANTHTHKKKNAPWRCCCEYAQLGDSTQLSAGVLLPSFAMCAQDNRVAQQKEGGWGEHMREPTQVPDSERRLTRRRGDTTTR